jgi:hypothetical protein
MSFITDYRFSSSYVKEKTIVKHNAALEVPSNVLLDAVANSLMIKSKHKMRPPRQVELGPEASSALWACIHTT